ncbi:MAG: CBS domain-containing protein [Erysipelotrichaceae bacterium]|nr:CBS domain-containing protein [Erysipelotrichaceae bacterium]
MFKVKDFMTKNVICTEKDTTISEIIDLMRENNIHRVPVVEDGKLAGLITEGMISNSGSTQATSLSIYELNYLLSKTKVSTIMVKDVHYVHEDDLMEFATDEMLKYDIGCLPVVDRENKVTGILTQNDVFSCFLNVLGWKDAGSRITIKVKDEIGAVGKLSKIFVDHNVNITHIGVYSLDNGFANLVIRCDAVDPTELYKGLEANGYEILEEYTNENEE